MTLLSAWEQRGDEDRDQVCVPQAGEPTPLSQAIQSAPLTHLLIHQTEKSILPSVSLR